MISMIATDLDGTLLRTDKTVSEYTRRVLSKCRERGYKVICATARGSTARQLAPFELFDGAVLMNGALGVAEGRLIYERRIAPEVMEPFLRALDAFGIRAAAEIGGTHYANFDVQAQWNGISDHVLTDFADLPAPADKLYALVERPGQITQIERALPDGLHMHLSRDQLAMVMHDEATKPNAVLAVAAYWGLSADQIAAFGDDANDIGMLRRCGIGVAMGNALPSVVSAANAVTNTNDEDGVAAWLARELLGE